MSGAVAAVAGPADWPEIVALRTRVFVDEQGLFTGSDRDAVDDDTRAVVLVARAADGTVLGGVRLAPATTPDLGWWIGARLVVRPGARRLLGVGAALVRAACAHAERVGALRFAVRRTTTTWRATMTMALTAAAVPMAAVSMSRTVMP